MYKKHATVDGKLEGSILKEPRLDVATRIRIKYQSIGNRSCASKGEMVSCRAQTLENIVYI